MFSIAYISSALNHFALRLLLNEVVLHAGTPHLLEVLLRIADSIGGGEADTIDGHADVHVVDEVFAAAHRLHLQATAIAEARQALNA